MDYRTSSRELITEIAEAALPAATFRRDPVVTRGGTLASKVHYHWGPNLLDGEVVLGIEPKTGYVLTDRRLAAVLEDGLFLVSYADIVDVKTEKRLLGDRLRLVTEGGGISLRHEREALHEFFSNVVKLTADDRRLAAPPVDGPANVGRSLRSGDDRVATLARLLAARVRAGSIEAGDAEAFAARVVLVDRTLANGRGMDEAFSWLTALSTEDLVAVVSERLGPGLEPVDDGVYELASTSEADAAVGVGLAMGSYGSPGMSAAMGGVTGVASNMLTRFTVSESPDATRFQLQVNILDEWTALAYAGRAGQFDAVMADVLAYELTGTLLRLLFGRGESLEDLVGRERAAVAAAATALDAEADVAPFWPAG